MLTIETKEIKMSEKLQRKIPNYSYKREPDYNKVNFKLIGKLIVICYCIDRILL